MAERGRWTGGIRERVVKEILIDHYGVTCWGCSFSPCRRPDGSRDRRYLEIDHMRPRSNEGSDELYNIAILCSPCNRRKGHLMTLEQLRHMNAERGDLYFDDVNDLIDLSDRERVVISKIIELAEKGETKKTLQDIFQIEMNAKLTVRAPALPEKQKHAALDGGF